MYQWVLIIAFVILIIAIGSFVYINLPKKPLPFDPINPPGPGPRPNRGNNWPMEKEIFFVEIPKPNKYDVLLDSTSGSYNLYAYFNDTDLLRMYPQYSIPNTESGGPIDMSFKNGNSYLLPNDPNVQTTNINLYKGGEGNMDPRLFDTNNPTDDKYYMPGALTRRFSINNRGNITNDTSTLVTGLPNIIYPVYGYKPARNIANSDTIFMRKSGKIYWRFLYNDIVAFGTNLSFSNLPNSTWTSSSALNILPFDNQTWSQYDYGVPTNTTNGAELFIIKSSQYYRTVFNSGYNFATMDQLYYCYSQGSNMGSIDSNNPIGAYIEGIYVSLYNSQNPSPNSSGNIQYYGSQSNLVTIDMTSDGYVLTFDYLNGITNTNSTVPVDNWSNSGSFNPYVYVWGIKPAAKDFLKVSPNCTEILPFAMRQDGTTQWSMYD